MGICNASEVPVTESITESNKEYDPEIVINSSYLWHQPSVNTSTSITECEASHCPCIKELITILKEYQTIGTEFTNNDDENKVNMPDFDVNIQKALNHFHHLLKEHDSEFESVYEMFIIQCNEGQCCNLSNCVMMRRNYRNRSKLEANSKEFEKIYFNPNNLNDIVIQQILDKMHCHFFHSFDIGHRTTSDERGQIESQQSISEEESKNIDDEKFTVQDRSLQALHKLISNKNNPYRDVVELRQSGKFSTTVEVDIGLNYSFGVRFFYWEYFKNCQEMNDPSRMMNTAHATPANEGCTMGEFYVAPKFKDLKDELINNLICSISGSQWDTLYANAEFHMKSDYLKTYKCGENMAGAGSSKKFFNIAAGDPITVPHIAAIMVYCNQDKLQHEMSKTYRRIPKNESNDSIINRHKNYAILGKLLRECTECYGSEFYKHNNQFHAARVRKLYHGMTIKSVFSSVTAIINGPVSTSTDYTVAARFCANAGMVLELGLDYMWSSGPPGSFIMREKSMCFFECWYVSDYPNEREVFFIGGYSKFLFTSIIVASEGVNYKPYIMTLWWLSQYWGIVNPGSKEEIVSKEMVQQIFYRILSDQLHKCYHENKTFVVFKSMPDYVRLLVERHFGNVKNISLQTHEKVSPFLYVMDQTFTHFFINDIGWIKLDELTAIFPKLEHIYFGRMRYTNEKIWEWKEIYLSVLSHLPKMSALKIILVPLPKQSDQAIQTLKKDIAPKFREQFKQFGWELSLMKYANSDDVQFAIHYTKAKSTSFRRDTEWVLL